MSTAASVGLAATSGLVSALADYPRPIPLLAWFATAPVLIAALRRGPRGALWLGVISGCFANVEPAREFLPVIPGVLVGAMISSRVALTAVTLALTVVVARRLSPALAVWAFAAAVVLGEWVGEVSGPGLWLTVASGQASVGWLRASSAVGGPYLVSFVVALVNGTLALLVIGPRQTRLMAALGTAITVGAVMLAGTLAAPLAPREARVAAVVHRLAGDVSNRWDQHHVRSEETWQVLAAYEALTRRAAAVGASVTVWPEYAVFVREADLPEWQARVASLARDTGVVVVAGYIDVDHGLNRALLATPDGGVDIYSKQALVPGMEDSWQHPGTEPFAAVSGVGLRIATRICYDLDFTGGTRAAGRAGVELLAVPARDWDGIEERHAMQSVFRAAENGVAMVRATRNGWSLLVDPSGRVLARESSVGGAEVLLVGDVPIVRSGTVYSRAGNWVVAVAALGLLSAVVTSATAREKPVRESASACERRQPA